MSLLYEGFPETVEINGSAYRVITDYREWIRWADMHASDIDDQLKTMFTYEMILDDCEEPFKDVFNALMAFFVMGEVEESKPGKQTISYDQDAAYIMADFQREYGIDIVHVKHLHWWQFQMLFEGLSEKSEMKQRIYYRSVNLESIKDKEERKRIRKIQRAVALKKEVSDGDIGNAFA